MIKQCVFSIGNAGRYMDHTQIWMSVTPLHTWINCKNLTNLQYKFINVTCSALKPAQTHEWRGESKPAGYSNKIRWIAQGIYNNWCCIINRQKCDGKICIRIPQIEDISVEVERRYDAILEVAPNNRSICKKFWYVPSVGTQSALRNQHAEEVPSVIRWCNQKGVLIRDTCNTTGTVHLPLGPY